MSDQDGLYVLAESMRVHSEQTLKGTRRGFEPFWPTAPEPEQSDDPLVPAVGEAELGDAYARGYADGVAEAERSARQREVQLVEAHLLEMAKIRADQQAELAASIVQRMTVQFADLENGLRRSVLALLGPVIVDKVESREMERLQSVVLRGFQLRGGCQIEITGPSPLADRVCEALSANGFNVILSEAPSSQLVISFGETEVRSDLPKVLNELKDILNEQ